MHEPGTTRAPTFASFFPLLLLALLAGCAAPSGHGTRTPSASTKPGQHIKECRNCPDMVVLPAGSFVMGSPPDEPERRDTEPQHRVTIARPFAVAATPITWNQWEACVRDRWCEGRAIDVALRTKEDGSRNPSYRDYGRGTRPAVGMSWYDAQVYVGWLNWKIGGDDVYRLPSEAEWEYAARGRNHHRLPGETRSTTTTATSACGNTASSAAYAEGRDVWVDETSPVGSFPPNAWGLYDMHGNVFEWTQDCYEPDLGACAGRMAAPARKGTARSGCSAAARS